MRLLRIWAIHAALLLCFLSVYPQETVRPNFGLKNPETIDVIRVRVTDEKTVVDMSILNMASGGYFCIDKNTYLECGNGKKLLLRNVTGLPLCPEEYKFSSIGEKVYFSLEFDRIPPETEWFDIIEYCGENCFSILGINLDETVNGKINAAFKALDRMDPEEAIKIFTGILPALKESGNGLTGSVYLNLVELLAANKRDDDLNELISDFRNSSVPHKDKYTEILKSIDR